MSLNDKLKKLDKYPFHMPGHKRNARFGITGAEIDITEIDGFDNLHSPSGTLLETENRLSRHYKSEKSFMLVNGSTVGILAAIFAVCSEDDKIIIARNCHKSVFNACYLRHLKIVYAEPEFDSKCGYYTELTQSTLDSVINDNPDAKAVVITSPTYEGIISKISADIPLIIDAAHGAHLGIPPFSEYPKGDIVVSSLHKTLPALTQTAVANVYNSEFTGKMKQYLDIFETSSPSYVLMNSVDVCAKYLQGCEDEFKSYYKRLTDFRKTGFMWLQIRHNDDIGKIVISTADASMNGSELAKILRDRYGIEAESISAEHIILMTSVADTDEAFGRLRAALLEIDRQCDKKSLRVKFEKPPCIKNAIAISVTGKSKAVELKDSAGLKANEYVYAYPPDIPLIVPGEIISAEIIEYISLLLKSGVNVISDSNMLPTINTKE